MNGKPIRCAAFDAALAGGCVPGVALRAGDIDGGVNSGVVVT